MWGYLVGVSGVRWGSGEAEDAGFLYELPEFHRHLKERRAEHAAVLHTRSTIRGAGESHVDLEICREMDKLSVESHSLKSGEIKGFFMVAEIANVQRRNVIFV